MLLSQKWKALGRSKARIPCGVVVLRLKLSRSQVHRGPKCDTHGHFCLIFGNIAIFINSSTLVSKINVAKLNSRVKMMFWDI